jgi:hypothetical protein
LGRKGAEPPERWALLREYLDCDHKNFQKNFFNLPKIFRYTLIKPEGYYYNIFFINILARLAGKMAPCRRALAPIWMNAGPTSLLEHRPDGSGLSGCAF